MSLFKWWESVCFNDLQYLYNNILADVHKTGRIKYYTFAKFIFNNTDYEIKNQIINDIFCNPIESYDISKIKYRDFFRQRKYIISDLEAYVIGTKPTISMPFDYCIDLVYDSYINFIDAIKNDCQVDIGSNITYDTFFNFYINILEKKYKHYCS